MVVRQAEEQFEAWVESRYAGRTQFIDDGGRRIFFHTEVAPEFGGQGVAQRLVGGALAQTWAAGLRVVPVCPFVRGYLTRHPELDGTVEAVTRETWHLVRDLLPPEERAAGMPVVEPT
ncbi:GNAT family N-acetyltransferase [Georgenia yuyongxinii]|nr:GNAT family N-acetyltransferase [Georgenia yuyongxinii]